MSLPATLVMTATVTPAAGMPGTQRSDVGTRRAEYLAAFEYYLGLRDDVIDHVVVLENSGEDLGLFRRAANNATHSKRISLVSCPTDYPSEKGKGYGEFLMLDFGIGKLLAEGQLQQNSSLWKVTGRLKVLNLEDLATRTKEQADVCCDLRSVPLIKESLGGNDWMELRLFSCTVAAYTELLAGRFDSGFVLEKTFFRIVKDSYDSRSLDIQPRFPVQPVIDGVSGFSGTSYLSVGYRLKGSLRRVSRRAAPWLWL